MPAPGGAERVVGNNPIAMALPTDDEFRSSSTWRPAKPPWAKSGLRRRPKKPIPPTWAVTATGEPTTNPAEAIAGMLLPSGGAKGFGLALMIDLMCGLLSRRRERRASASALWRFCRALRLLASLHRHRYRPFLRLSTGFGGARRRPPERIRGGERAPGVSQLFTPGEPEWRRAETGRWRGDARPGGRGHADTLRRPSSASRQTRFSNEG